MSDASRHREAPRAAAGFSLAEVVVALGLLAGVMISAAGIMVVGTRYVTSGRRGSIALSVARDAVEEIEGWSFHRVLDELGCDPAGAACSVDFDAPAAAVAGWRQNLREALPNGAMAVEVTPLDGAASLGAATGFRFAIRIDWSDGPRSRDVELVTVRM